MKRILTLVLLLATSLSMMGGPIDETAAKKLAENFWKQNNIMGVRNGQVYKNQTGEAQFVNVAPQHGYSEFFIFNNMAGKGYVIIAADESVIPVLGYSYENNFGTETLPPNLKAWLDGYAEQIRQTVAMRAAATEEIRADWECLRQGKTLPIKSETAVPPLVATRWSQSPYYNDKCPYDYNHNSRTLTGCVATAMAQIMKYWNYPEHGFGSHSYVPESHPEYGTLYVDFSAVNYPWNSMPTSVNSSNDAVATLMYHCGVSVDMNYGISGSPDYGSAAYIIDNGSGRPCAENALKSYFDYKNTLHAELKSDYSDSQWINILKTELDNSKPMIYGGFGSGGHAFVCDGYDNNNYIHFNWGWGGSYDDYYYINSLNPASQNYTQNQQALVGIEPKYSGGGGGSSGAFELVYHCNLSMDYNQYWFYDDFSVYAEVLNSGEGDFSGYIGAGVFRRDDNGEFHFLNVMGYWDKTSNPLHPNYYSYGTLQTEGGPPYTPGSYGIAMLYSFDLQLWNFIEGNNYHDVFFNIVYSTDIETFSDFNILTGDYLYYGMSSTINVDIWNSGSSTFYGKFRVNLANQDGTWAQNIDVLDCTDGLQANYHFIEGLDFTGEITVEPGSYYMELGYQKSGESDWYYAGASRYQNPVRVEVVAAPVSPDPYETNNTAGSAYALPCNFYGNSANVSTTGSNLHNGTDIDYYKIQLNPGQTYTITPRLNDSYNSDEGTYYTVDAKFAYSTDGSNWSDFYDDVMQSNITMGGGTLYLCVMPYFEGKTGTYLLNIHIAIGTGVDESDETAFSIYPNPVREVLNINCMDAKEIRLFNPLGVLVRTINTEGKDNIQIDMSGLPCGTYIMQTVIGQHLVTRKVVKTE
jgi:hypothetical protein